MKELKMLAIDLGASSGRGIVGSFDGEKLTLRETHRFSNDPVITNGRMYWDILRIFYEIKQSITKTVLDGDNVSSIGIDTWGVDYALLDKSGRMLANPIHYRDTRTKGITDHVAKTVPLSELYAKAGIQSLNFNTIYQLAADLIDDPDDASFATPGNMPERVREYCRRTGQHVPATAIGNLMMQAIAAGEVADLKQARQIVAASFELKMYEPSSDRAMWDEAYGRFCALN